MLVILANRWDESARELATLWTARNARVMTPRDLSRPGWRQRLGRPEEGTVVIGDEVIRQEEVTGVLTRLSCVYEQELNYISEADRSFVAAEMNAFLVFWLTSLKCPVINRPAPGCLNGPAFSPERWTQAAARAGLSVDAKLLQNNIVTEELTSVTVVGGRALGTGGSRLREEAGALARSVGVDLVEVRFGGSRFLEVNLLPETRETEVIQAVLELFEGGR